MKSTSRIAAAIVASLLLVGAFAVAGCGGSDDTSSTATALSKEEFLAQGNQICAEGNKTIQAAGQELAGGKPSQAPGNGQGGGKPSQADLDQFATDTLIPTIQGEIDGLKALAAPAGDEEQVAAITDAAQTALDKASDDPSSLTSGNQPFKEANDLANAYGLTECGG